MAKTIKAVKGTTDFYPEEMALRTWLYEKIRTVSQAFGYQEYEGPILETLELYAAKSGEEIVNEQAYVFPDRGGELISLRPELTPTLARMIAQRQKSLTFPVRWWSFGPMWRYERPQKGRAREFFQWNIDLIGMDSPEADAEIAAIGAAFLQQVGLTPEMASIRVNNRRLMDAELERIGIQDDFRQKVFQLIDKLEKLPAPQWEESARTLGLSETQISLIRGLVNDQDLWKKSGELNDFFLAAEALEIRQYLDFSPGTIRGLNYYTGIIFECFTTQGNLRSVFAGGRYDNLVADVGGDPLPGVGFAMGDKVIGFVLAELGLLPDFSQARQVDVFVTTFDRERMPEAFRTATSLRQHGLRVATYPGEARLGKQLKYASQLGAKVAIILGPEEIEAETIVIRDMDHQEQRSLPRGTVLEEVRRILAQANPS